MAAFDEDGKTISLGDNFSTIDWDDGHRPGGDSTDKNNPTKMAINHDKAGDVPFTLVFKTLMYFINFCRI